MPITESEYTELTTLRNKLEVLNESIYEPEEHMQPSERNRRIDRSRAMAERIRELETAVAETDE